MTTYKLYKSMYDTEPTSVIRSDGWQIPFDHANTDYQQYLAWLVEGNTPAPADPVDPLPAIKELAKQKLEDTDFAEVADVAAILANKAAFDSYRAAVRAIYLNPTANPTWPERPVAVWV